MERTTIANATYATHLLCYRADTATKHSTATRWRITKSTANLSNDGWHSPGDNNIHIAALGGHKLQHVGGQRCILLFFVVLAFSVFDLRVATVVAANVHWCWSWAVVTCAAGVYHSLYLVKGCLRKVLLNSDASRLLVLEGVGGIQAQMLLQCRCYCNAAGCCWIARIFSCRVPIAQMRPQILAPLSGRSVFVYL